MFKWPNLNGRIRNQGTLASTKYDEIRKRFKCEIQLLSDWATCDPQMDTKQSDGWRYGHN